MKRVVVLLALCMFVLLAVTPAFSQAVFGSIFGTVTDPAGRGCRWRNRYRNRHRQGHVGHGDHQRERKLFRDSLDS